MEKEIKETYKLNELVGYYYADSAEYDLYNPPKDEV